MHKILIVLLIGVTVARAFVCEDDYCDDVQCEPVHCTENQQYTKGGSACGCCDTCYRIVKNGGSCYDYFDWGAEPPQMVCDEGLSCDYDTRVCQ